MPVGVRIQVVGLDALQQHLADMAGIYEAAPRQVVMGLGAELKVLMQAEAPVGKGPGAGALRRGIRYRTVGSGADAQAVFTSEAYYTPFVIEGTKPHDIWAGFYEGRAGKMALWWPGAAHPTPYVQHPGTAPNDFPSRAMDRLEPAADALLEATGDAIVEARPS